MLTVEATAPDERFITMSAPGGAPFNGAFGTAAYPKPDERATMLVVGPGSCIPPERVSFVVVTTSTLLFEVSRTSRVARFGAIAIRPGAFPAPNCPARVSVVPLTTIRPGFAVGLATLCEARTRAVC